VEIYTIGFTQKSAEGFFGLLKQHQIKRLIDIRLNNTGQLAGFTKQSDLQYFLREICSADYIHQPLLAPTKELLSNYRHGKCTWEEYEQIFHRLMVDRCVDTAIDRSLFQTRAVLLCSEATAEQCHRRLVAEYLNDHWGDIDITHL
jgi:uncharacterized protein (DUF488 family)